MTRTIFQDFEQNRDHTMEILDGITYAVTLFTVSSEIRFLYFNRAASELFGYAPGELLSLTDEDPLQIFHPDSEDQLFTEIIKSMREERIFSYDCRILCKDGSYKWTNLSADLVQTAEGTLYYHCVLSEIEAPKELRLKGLRALIAAGTKEDLTLIETLITEQGGVSDAFNNGLDALDHFTESAPDFYQCVFIGCRMRDINGFELSKEIRCSNHRNAKHIPLILISNPDDRENISDAGDLCITQNLEKPLDPSKITAALMSLI